MDKYSKFDNIDIFPDISIDPVEEIEELKTEEKVEPAPIKREPADIFKQMEEKQPEISKDVPAVAIDDIPDEIINDAIGPPKKRGRGKDKQKRKVGTTPKQLEGLAKARAARQVKLKFERENKLTIEEDRKIKSDAKKKSILDKLEKLRKIEEAEEEAKHRPVQLCPSRAGRPTSINDFDTFCSYMNKYKATRKPKVQIQTGHPNKMVNKNLLPRPPLIPAQRTQPKNVFDPNYAINMLSHGRNNNRFKDPFNR
jgi:hypothetical protein